MKIEWLNDEMTEAVITVGWFRKRCARVHRLDEPTWHKTPGRAWWRFASGREVPQSSAIDRHRDAERRLRERDADWQPVRALPEARTVRRG